MNSGSLSRRILGSVATCFVIASLTSTGNGQAVHPNPPEDFGATPQTTLGCLNPTDLQETTQGRVPAADHASGRAAQGYSCNASEVSHVGSQDQGTGASGGYRVYRYVDTAGHVCAFYDTTLLFPANLQRAEPPGVSVLWMNDPANPGTPVRTASLVSPAMLSPHESFSLNVQRGLLGAVFGNPTVYPGQFDLYEVSQDCRQPTLKASLPMGILGHEGSFAPDGNTYYAASLFGHTLVAIDTSITAAPRTIWTSADWNIHGLNASIDGKTLYLADNGSSGLPGSPTKGLTILDVTQVWARELNPQVSPISHLTWSKVSTPQTVIPFKKGPGNFLLEVDEFGSGSRVGAARIINIANPANPAVVSNIRLAVNNAANQGGDQQNDPNAKNSLQGYTAHYCAIPTEVDPKIVACSFILSGLRVFDISDLSHPVEIAYFNKPATVDKIGLSVFNGPQGSYAMSQPAFDVANHRIWYSDGNSGFYVVQINPAVWP